jgi:hypothetical protein
VTWGFIWLMFILKIPIFGLFGIVYWAIKQPADEPQGEQPVRPTVEPVHPRSRVRRPKRPRGPHGDPLPLPPPRSRPVTAYGREHVDR